MFTEHQATLAASAIRFLVDAGQIENLEEWLDAHCGSKPL
jgi:hypothetical protein